MHLLVAPPTLLLRCFESTIELQLYTTHNACFIRHRLSKTIVIWAGNLCAHFALSATFPSMIAFLYCPSCSTGCGSQIVSNVYYTYTISYRQFDFHTQYESIFQTRIGFGYDNRKQQNHKDFHM